MSGTQPIVLDYPLAGRWMAVNSPGRRVPSHGTHRFGLSHAIDLVPVDEAGRSGPITWRTIFTTEPAERFVGFGAPVLAPVSGTVVACHDAEPDHQAHRSLGAGLPYLLTQPGRLRQGVEAVVGNHVVLAVARSGPFVLLAHLQRGSIAVRMGQRVQAGEVVAACNSGNSTQPHVHLYATA